MSKFKAVVFDLGDVYYQNGFKKALAHLVLRHTLKSAYYKTVFYKPYIRNVELGQISEKEFWIEFRKDAGVNIDIPTLRKQVFAYFKPEKGMRKLAEDCRKKIKVGLLTNNIKDWFRAQENHENFKKRFDTVVVSAYVGLRKPEKGIYQLMAKNLHVKPEECIFFDDMIDNVKGAKRAGMTAFRFKSAKEARVRLKKMGVI